MRLFIRIQDGQPFEHPILEDNFKQAFPHIDADNLPNGFADFVRVAPPIVGVFELLDTAYQMVNGVWTDVYTISQMTAEQKADKIAQAYAELPDGWSLNEETLRASPPPSPEGDYWVFDLNANAWIDPRQSA